MSFILLAWRNTSGNTFRSTVVIACAALMAGFSIAAAVIIGGAEKSLNLALERLGADIIVVPAGTEHLMENAYLMGVPALAWMPEEFIESISAVPGVEIVSPQFYLATLRGATCCSVPEMFLIAYDPETDFTLRPWLEENLEGELELGEAVGGSFVYVPVDPGYILVYGYHIHLKGKFSQTGTGLDQSMFFTFDTAREISRLSPFQAEAKMEIPENSISAAMVKVATGSNPAQVARQIQQILPEVTPVESSNLFKEQRIEILALLQSVTVLLGVAWLLSVALVGLLFSMAVNERSQEIGVLRAIGSTRLNVLNSLLAEGVILAFAGSILGVILSIFSIYLFRDLLIQLMGFPFLIPPPLSLALITLAALAVALVSVILGVLLPAVRISALDPAVAMRK
jgi:putative ABC transport system permease protein